MPIRDRVSTEQLILNLDNPNSNSLCLGADLVKMMTDSKQPLLNMLAVDIAKSQEKRGSQTVGFRFREQLQDLISRLDECVN